MSKYLETHGNQKELDLSYNQIKDIDVKIISSVIAKNFTVEKLNLCIIYIRCSSK